MPNRTSKPLIVTGGVALVLIAMLLVGAGLAGWSTQRTLETLRLVDHTRQVRLELERLHVAVVSAEGALRGFLITHDDSFVARVQSSLSDAAEAYSAVDSLTWDDPDQQRRLEHFSLRLEERTLSIRQQATPEAALAFTPEAIQAAIKFGKEKLEEIRRLIREMEDVEDEHLERRAAAARKASRETGIVVAFGTLIAVILVLASAGIIWRDFKARKRAASELMEARNYADSIVDTVRDALLVLDPELRVARANRSFFEMFRLSPEAIEGKPLSELSNGAWTNAPLQARLKAILEEEDGEFRNLEVEKTFPRLGVRVMSVSGRRLQRMPGGSDAVLLSIEDITERKHADRQVIELNRELQQRAALLEAANVELEAFSYSVSHDLRAPLRHIDGFADMLRKHVGETLDPTAQRYLNTISASAKRMGTLIDDLLLFSRMGRAEMNRTTVELEQLVEEALAEVQVAGESRNVEWTRAPLPTVEGDRGLLRQVFVNLLSNALKYSRTRDPALIEVGTVPGEVDETIVYVKDNGVGFDMAYAKKLFGVFQRLHGNNEFEGTGIGLANVRRIVSRHGGRTWAEGRVGEGATFYFSLPRRTTGVETQFQSAVTQ